VLVSLDHDIAQNPLNTVLTQAYYPRAFLLELLSLLKIVFVRILWLSLSALNTN